jgi:hypothetical protein
MFGLFKKNHALLNMDAWSDGQVASKLWLCENLERVCLERKIPTDTVWIFGSWYGTLPYLLLTRQRLLIKKLVCFDVDADANKIAWKILNHWQINGPVIEIYNQDCSQITIESPIYKQAFPNLIINTSCEHMKGYAWWSKVPAGVHFAFQSTNMAHPTHINSPSSLIDFQNRISPARFDVNVVKEFRYPKFEFDRYMLIGQKL